MKTEYIFFSFLFSSNFNFFIKNNLYFFSKFSLMKQILKYNFNPIRNDIIDRNGILLSRNITAYHAAIRPNLIKDKKIFCQNKISFTRNRH